ncbi:unnamed protein product [Blepharisma stoltei]|uniref:V-type proton ATPase subunit C n=1 Tax=Blepharisma stoltei TaxID=1481888 RepID=A0AAU9JQ42_9CILI|nr:unnamed protein product [Blepharisma stoltei]
MEQWLVSVQCQPSQKDSITQVIEQEVMQTSSRPLGRVHLFNCPIHFKVGSLDQLVALADDLNKLDHHLEGVVKKVERQFVEIEPNPHLTIDNPFVGNQQSFAPIDYVANFQWNNSKYPPTKTLQELSGLIEERMRALDDDVKNKTVRYQEAKNSLGAITKKESGNLYSKDLAEIITSAIASPEDFINSEHLKTYLIVLPKKDVKKWLEGYEFLDSGVVPRSTKQFDVEDKDLTLWRVVVLKPSADSFVSAVKQNKWAAREFSFDPAYTENQAASKEKVNKQFQTQHNLLWRACKVVFSELFIALIHLKAMRIFAESVLRYSLPPQFVSFYIIPERDREKRVLDSMVKKFMRPGETADMYGSRDDSDENEDFFPFVFVRLPSF